MEAILRLDKRNADELRQVIIFAQGDKFWRTDILSPDKLRKQYDQLNAKRLQQVGRYGGGVRRAEYDKGVVAEHDGYENFFK